MTNETLDKELPVKFLKSSGSAFFDCSCYI